MYLSSMLCNIFLFLKQTKQGGKIKKKSQLVLLKGNKSYAILWKKDWCIVIVTFSNLVHIAFFF